EVGGVIARDQRRTVRGDPLEMLEAPPEPEPRRRQRDGLGRLEPRFCHDAPPDGSREPSRSAPLGWFTVRAIVLPVKSLDEAKTRRAPARERPDRPALPLARPEAVIDAPPRRPGWETWVVSPDEAVLEVAANRRDHPRLPAGEQRRGVDHVFEHREGERGPK